MKTLHMKTIQIMAAAIFVAAMSAPAMAGSDGNMPHTVRVDPPKCEITTVKHIIYADPIEPEQYDSKDPNFRCGACSSGISYTNGKAQSGEYSFVPGMETSRVGDLVRLCLVSYLAPCPRGDDRGKTYVAMNLRTGMKWKRANAQHMCGGA